MSFEGSTSTFALIAFSSFLTLLISHLAVRQSSPQIIQAPFPTLQSAQLPSSPPIPAAPSPPPPPPPPPSQAALPLPQYTHIITSPSPQALATELNGSFILLILVLLVLLFGVAGQWLECLHFRGGLGNKSKGSRCKTKKKGYVSTSSDDEGEEESSCQDQEAQAFPGGWHEDKCSPSSTWRDKMKRKVGERMKEAVGDTTATTSSRIKPTVRKASEHAGQQNSACCTCPPLPSFSSPLSMSREGEQTAEQQPSGGTTSSIKSTSGNNSGTADKEKVEVDEAWKEQLLSRVAKLEDQTKSSMALASISSAKKEKTESFTTKTSAKAEVPGEEGATARSNESTTTKSKGVKQGNAKVLEDRVEVLYAEPPMAMAEVAAARVDVALEEVPLLGGKSAGDAKQVDIKSTQPSQVDVQGKASKKGKGKQKEGVASEVDKAATPSPEESMEGTGSSEVQKSGPSAKCQDDLQESGKNPGKIAKGLQKLADVTKDNRDEVINHVLIEVEDGGDSRVRRADGQDRSNARASDDKEQRERDEMKGGEAKTVSDRNTQQGSSKAKSNETTTKPAVASRDNEKEGMTKVAETKTTGKNNKGKSEVGGGEGTAASEGVAAGTRGVEGATKATAVDEKSTMKAKTVGSTSKEPLGDAQAQQNDQDGATLYYQTADYLSGQYSGLVSHKSKQVNEFLDKEFTAASEAAGLKINLPWYRGGVEEDRGKQAEGEGGSSEAVKRALDLFHEYKQGSEKDGKPGAPVSPNAVAPSSNRASDKVLQTLINALLEAQRAEGKAALPDKPHDVSEKSKTASECVQDDAKSASSYPSVIPLEAVNADSLEKVGVWAKQQERQAHHHKIEKTTQINEALQLLSADTRKNVHYIKEDLDTLKEGATLKVRTLKGLLKKKKTIAPAPSPSDELEGCKQSSLPRKKKSVRLQDAAGHGEGPRDVAMGETEEQARYRRLREMASRLNE